MYYVIEAQNVKTNEKIIVINTRPAERPGRDDFVPYAGEAHGWDIWSHDGPYTLHGAEVVIKSKWPQAKRTKTPEPHSSHLCALGKFAGGEAIFAYEVKR